MIDDSSPSYAADRITLMQTFVTIVEAGNLSAAAVQLATSQPTISRRLQALERSLGLSLLQRSTHGMKLTRDGERCFEGAKELLAAWAAFESDLRGVDREPEGTLRVVVPHAFGQQQLVGPLAAYLQRYPQVSVEWLLRDGTPNFIAEGIDCALQVGEVTDESVVAIRLSQVPRIVVAAPSVLGGRPTPQDVDALADLPWLSLRSFYRNEISLTHSDTGERRALTIRPRMSTDSLYALRNAALLGLGACIASTWMLVDDLAQQRLVQLAPRWTAAPLPLHLVYPHARFYPARLRSFVDAMRAALPEAMD